MVRGASSPPDGLGGIVGDSNLLFSTSTLGGSTTGGVGVTSGFFTPAGGDVTGAAAGTSGFFTTGEGVVTGAAKTLDFCTGAVSSGFFTTGAAGGTSDLGAGVVTTGAAGISGFFIKGAAD